MRNQEAQIRRPLRAGQKVVVRGLSRYVDGVKGVVVRLVDRGNKDDLISSEGTWTIAVPDCWNGGTGFLNREFQRRYLRPLKKGEAQ